MNRAVWLFATTLLSAVTLIDAVNPPAADYAGADFFLTAAERRDAPRELARPRVAVRPVAAVRP